jgi:release factor glutamine methyltransferase
MNEVAVSEVKKRFVQRLKPDYPKGEIQSFFFRLTEKVLGKTRLDLALEPNLKLTEKQFKQFRKALNRLKNHEPIQYIIGETEFYGLRFRVKPSVLIPRPETEELVEWILEENPTDFSAFDIGTGSGCIPIALASNRENSLIKACDISAEALEIAEENAKLNNVKVHFQLQDIFKLKTAAEKFDILISNPPYVRDLEKAEIHRNVLNHEPKQALFVPDSDPLIFYRKIAELAPIFLNENGKIYLEINEFLSQETAELFHQKGFSEIVLKKDMFGKERFLRCGLNPAQ